VLQERAGRGGSGDNSKWERGTKARKGKRACGWEAHEVEVRNYIRKESKSSGGEDGSRRCWVGEEKNMGRQAAWTEVQGQSCKCLC